MNKKNKNLKKNNKMNKKEANRRLSIKRDRKNKLNWKIMISLTKNKQLKIKRLKRMTQMRLSKNQKVKFPKVFKKKLKSQRINLCFKLTANLLVYS